MKQPVAFIGITPEEEVLIGSRKGGIPVYLCSGKKCSLEDQAIGACTCMNIFNRRQTDGNSCLIQNSTD